MPSACWALYPEVALQINIQPISKRDHSPDGSLLVHSIFHTIQGEGPLTGHPAVFVRLAGCNLQCPKCDTEYTEGAQFMSATAVFAHVQRLHPGPVLVVITGGEPLRQNIEPLCWLLADADYQVQIETNGTLPLPDFMPSSVMIVCSPKTGRVHPRLAPLVNAYKYVASDGMLAMDGLPTRALDHTAEPYLARPTEGFPRGAVYLQPTDEKDEVKNKRNLQAVISSCMAHGYTLQLQTHKIIGLE